MCLQPLVAKKAPAVIRRYARQKNSPRVRNASCSAHAPRSGIQSPQLLDYQDGCLADADAERLTARILTAVAATGAQVLLSFGPDGLSGHSDHVAIGRCATEAYCRAESLAALYTVAVPASLAQALGMHQLHAVPDADVALDSGCIGRVGGETDGHPLSRHSDQLVAAIAGAPGGPAPLLRRRALRPGCDTRK